MRDAPIFNPLKAYAHWVSSVSMAWPDAAHKAAQRAIIDVLACMMPGSQDPVVDKLYGLVRSWGDGPATVIGRAAQLSAPMAALINGTSAHALDFDDNFDPAKAHATAVLIPAILAVAEQEKTKSDAVIDAYIVGLQIMGRVGQAVNPFHRSRGWHATATLGAIGAAAACARLLQLNEEQAAHAISLATSRAAGFMSQFGTDTKPLHAGFAASGGVEAALFARAGLTAGSDTLHGATGLRMLMVGPDVEDLANDMAGCAEHGQTVTFRDEDVGTPLHLLHHGLKVKRFPNCGSVHRALDGLLDLHGTHGFTEHDVDHVLVRAPAAHLRNLMYDRPTTPAEAKFSLEYNLSVALFQGHVDLADFTPEKIARPNVTQLLSKIRKEYVDKLESEFPTEIHVHLKDGMTLSTSFAMPVGSKDLPLSDTQLWSKFDSCARAAPCFGPIAKLRQAAECFAENHPVGEAMTLFQVSGSPDRLGLGGSHS